jgi:hypothetical protein
MKNAAIKLAVALALLGAFAVTSATFMRTGTSAAAATGCIPEYDSSGAQTAPYC